MHLHIKFNYLRAEFNPLSQWNLQYISQKMTDQEEKKINIENSKKKSNKHVIQIDKEQ